MKAIGDENQTTNLPPTNPEIPINLTAIADYYLTFNCISTLYQAYTHGDFPMVGFIVMVYFGYLGLMYCINQLRALPPTHTSPKKDFLKSIIWVLATVILVGFALQFSTFVHPLVAVFVFAAAVSTSYFLFFLYFVHDCYPHQSANSCCIFRIKVSRGCCANYEVIINGSKITRDVVPGPENV
ncbi:hypothetical protein E1A91_A09G024200v1 [Gossypium mustelinum]|uniref:Uncharacterized protein n=3 Tax=Gossypium TaxID=3633 RepID=A0A2P5Y6K0_GOSBA|nr:hypothetical protein ES319_A09G022200v1 [Gossypium barbadense]PPS11199.1 hypothetical protein GOBAR_AA09455 [Gossypium barbadense]TYH01058.1 hypothetical protein ES288_A09G027200v1 [Gossypium darwinii]TYJ17042.1 hypothetical protein E1A91_A09G024200v1 [Gossypium mustelinum]